MAAKLFYLPFPTAFTTNGLPAAGARLFFYLTGTLTPQDVYTTSALATAHSNPVVANGAGRFPTIYTNDATSLRLIIKDAAGNTLDDVDPYIPGTAGSPGPPGANSGTGANASTRAAMAGIVSPAVGTPVILTEAGREGTFGWDSANLSAKVTNDPNQGIYVAPASATTGASGAWVRKYDGPLQVKWFGAKGDTVIGFSGATITNVIISGTDDAAAIQAAITFANYSGHNELHFATGVYRCNSALSMLEMNNLVLVGEGGSGSGYRGHPAARIYYTGTASPFLNLKSTVACGLKNMGIIYTSASFTGTLIDMGTTGLDTHYALIERCLLTGYPNTGAAMLVDLRAAILGRFHDNHISYAQVGFRGRHPTTIDYSNAHDFTGNTFNNLAIADFLNAGENWVMDKNRHEGGPRAYWDNLPAGQICDGLTIRDPWMGDSVLVTDAFVSTGTTQLRGATFSGGLYDTQFSPANTPCIKLTTVNYGVTITGIKANTTVDLGSVAHVGVFISGNYLGQGVVNLSNNARDITIMSNVMFSGIMPTVIRFGAWSGTGAVAGPSYIDMGDDYSATGGTNLKLRISGSSVAASQYGFGVSAGQMDYVVPAGSKHAFYEGTIVGARIDTNGINLPATKSLKVNSIQVVGAQGAAVADATDAATAITQLNAALARLRTHGLIAT